MKVLPEDTGRFSSLPKQQHKDALAPICEINEQCLQMLVGAARQSTIPPDNFLYHLFSLVSPLNESSIVTAARFPFLLVDFGFRDVQWWRRITSRNARAETEPSWLVPFPRASALKLARATLMLAWHSSRTDADITLVLLGMSQQVAEHISALKLSDLDRIADRHFRRLRPRWEDRPAVWRQLLTCSRETDVDAAHEFVLHAVQLTAAGALPAVALGESTKGQIAVSTSR